MIPKLQFHYQDLDAMVPNGKPGVTAWWMTPPWITGASNRKRIKNITISWEQLILISPNVSWPIGVKPFDRPEWKECGVRIGWIKGLGKLYYDVDVPVPDISRCLGYRQDDLIELKRLNSPRDSYQPYLWFEKLGTGGQGVYLHRSVVNMIYRAFRSVDYTLIGDDWCKDNPVVLAFKNDKLRAIATTMRP